MLATKYDEDPMREEFLFNPNNAGLLEHNVCMEDGIDGVINKTDLSLHGADLE